MRKLNQIIMINAAGFDYVEFPVGDHAQVIGVNGHGKSTLLRTILFFYLGTNEKPPYALHETKTDFVSHYLGSPPSYLIYEISRGPEEPSFHIVVTRPAGRIQFYFIDAPYRKEYYVNDSFVQTVDSVLKNLRDNKCPFDNATSYEEFNHRIYGIASTTFSVFRPLPRSSGNVGILPRIISGIFTVSQLDADKLKSVLTCGVREGSLSTELDLVNLKTHLQNFRRVNNAVRTYLHHERDALDLISLADQFETIKDDRKTAIEELIRMAKRLPQEETGLNAQKAELDKEETEADDTFKKEDKEHEQALEKLRADIAVCNNRIKKGNETAAEYKALEIDRKSRELEQLPAIKQELQFAHDEYTSLTTEYEDEKQQKEHRLTSLQNSWKERTIQITNQRASHEKEQREKTEEVEKERKIDLEKLEDDYSSEKLTLQKNRKRITSEQDNLIDELKGLANTKEPPELIQLRTTLQEVINSHRNEVTKQEKLRSQAYMAKEKSKHVRERIDRNAESEIGELNSTIKSLEAERDGKLEELDKFDSSLACFFQKNSLQSWPQVSKTLNKKTLFHDAIDLDAKVADGDTSSVWGVEITTDKLPSPDSDYSRDDLAASFQKTKTDLAQEHDKLRAANDRYLAAVGEHDNCVAEERNKVELEIQQSQELAKNLQAEKVRLESKILTIESQYTQSKDKRRKLLEQREKAAKQNKTRLDQDEKEIEERYKTRRKKINDDFNTLLEDLRRQASLTLNSFDDELAAAKNTHNVEAKRIEEVFEEKLSSKGVNTTKIERTQERINKATMRIDVLSGYEDEVRTYKQLRNEYIDPLPSLKSQKDRLEDSLNSKVNKREQLISDYENAKSNYKQRHEEINTILNQLTQDKNTVQRFKGDRRFVLELGLFSREDLGPAPFYRPQSIEEFSQSATNSHDNMEEIAKKGNKHARTFLNRFNPETLERKVLGFSPIHEHFDWIIFVGSELKPFVNGCRIQGMKQIQTQEFEQLIRNICSKNSDFNEGIRQVKRTATAIETHLKEHNFVDVLDSIELKVERVDNNLTRVLSEMEQFTNVSFSDERDLFGKQADRSQIDQAINAFKNLLREIDNYPGDSLQLTNYFDLSIRIYENGHNMGWRKSIDHIGSTGTDYLVKMLIYLSLIEIYRERVINPKTKSIVHCILDETGVLAPKYVRSVLQYAKSREIVLITAGHSQQTMGFKNWMHVRKCGSRFVAQTVLQKVLKCD